MADDTPAMPPLPGERYQRHTLRMLVTDPDEAKRIHAAPPDFRGCALAGQIACLTNLLSIERSLPRTLPADMRQASRDVIDLLRARAHEQHWLSRFELLAAARSETAQPATVR